MHMSVLIKNKLVIFGVLIFGHLQCQIPIIYHEAYNIKLEDLFGDFAIFSDFNVPFDTEKYGKIFDFLKSNGLDEESCFVPSPVTKSDLQLVHSDKYLSQLNSAEYLSEILEVPQLRILSGKIIETNVLRSFYMAAGGTVLGCQLALRNGWAINLSGGYHHAKTASGGGFCVISDIAIAIEKYWKTNPNSRVLIVDLDAHQGTGYAQIFLSNGGAFIFDIYNPQRPPVRLDIQQDIDLRARINFEYPVQSGIKDAEYLKILQDHLAEAIKLCNPDLIIYVAGADVFCGDCGGMQISQEGIIRRDEYVFFVAEQLKKPILMLLAGGYSKQSAEITGKSILNILRKKGVLSTCYLM
ncbi:MAG: histone deacetylase [bacterium]